MSSGSDRDPLCGVIVQRGKVVGAISIPELSDHFVEEFNNCYGPIRLQCSQLDPEAKQAGTIPTYRHRLPTWYREAWQPRITTPTPQAKDS